MWLSIHHEKRDSRKACDSEKDTDLSPVHIYYRTRCRGRLRGANSRKTDWRGGSQRTSPSFRGLPQGLMQVASYAAITPLVSDGEQHAGKGVAGDLFGRDDRAYS
jgi:hypothetical protein